MPYFLYKTRRRVVNTGIIVFIIMVKIPYLRALSLPYDILSCMSLNIFTGCPNKKRPQIKKYEKIRMGFMGSTYYHKKKIPYFPYLYLVDVKVSTIKEPRLDKMILLF